MNTITVVSQIAIVLILFSGLFFLFYKPARIGARKLPAIVFLSAVFFAAMMLNWVGINYHYGAARDPGGIFKFGAALGISLKMFSFDWEREIWEAPAREDVFYTIAITLCFVSAVLGAALLLVRLLLKNLWNALSVFFLAYSGKKLWLIAGAGTHQKALLENLAPEQKSNAIIIPNECNEEAKKEYLARGFLIIIEPHGF
jgi:hypothetical protein